MKIAYIKRTSRGRLFVLWCCSLAPIIKDGMKLPWIGILLVESHGTIFNGSRHHLHLLPRLWMRKEWREHSSLGVRFCFVGALFFALSVFWSTECVKDVAMVASRNKGNAYKCWGWRCEDPPPMSSWCMSRKCSCSFQNAAITWQRVFVVVGSSKEEGIILALNSYCIKVGFFLFWHHLSHLLGWTTCCEFLLQLDTFL